MIAYRIVKEFYAHDLSGRGAEKYGGRWNSKGNPVLYTSINRALALAEVLVHLPYSYIPDDLIILTIELSIKESQIYKPKLESIENKWDEVPYNNVSQEVGDRWIRDNRYLAMKIPSVIIKGEHNLLVNPKHLLFDKVVIKEMEPFIFDRRLRKG